MEPSSGRCSPSSAGSASPSTGRGRGSGRTRRFLRATAGTAIFGASDGLVSITGVIILLASQAPRLVFPAAAMGAVSAAYSMASGEAMGQERTSWAAVPVMAASTFAGTVAPALPFLWSSGWAALAQAGAIALLIALLVGHARSWRRHRYAETVVIIGFGVLLTAVCSLLVPGGSA